MSTRIHTGDIHLTDLRTRMPFKYGIATMTSTPHVFVRMRVEVDSKPAIGIAADHLPPKWFTKDPDKGVEDEIGEMLEVIEHAVASAAGLSGDSPFDVWRQLYEAQTAWGRRRGFPPLLANFGTTLVERAMIEAVCKSAGQPFARALRANRLGIRLGEIHPSLAEKAPADLLPKEPLGEVIARHTIGLADPLADDDIPVDERLEDGLPQSLAACIKAYGLRHFKIKVSGSLESDLDRLQRIADVIVEQAPADYAFSLDGNEQFKTPGAFQTFWDSILRRERLRPMFGHLLFVEQPFHRDVALDPTVMAVLRDWFDRPPMIIDESDAELDSLPRALELGYAGTSHKNCKGVFRGVANTCLLEHLRRQSTAGQASSGTAVSGRECYLMSGEDLASTGPVSLLQDLTVAASLGIESIERNGHHYFAGLSAFPDAVQRQVLTAHSDLYYASSQAWPTLSIRDGRLRLGSLLAAPLGVGFEIDVEQFCAFAAVGRQSSPP